MAGTTYGFETVENCGAHPDQSYSQIARDQKKFRFGRSLLNLEAKYFGASLLQTQAYV